MAEAFPSNPSSTGNFKDRGVVTEWLDKLSKEWSSFPLLIAVIGGSGSGKSSFINSIRGVKQDDEGAAKSDVVQTTQAVETFSFPNNEKMTLVDLPGAGTPEWPKEKYIEKIGGIRNFDLFLILSCSRFTQIDRWLAEELIRNEKPFYFIRTKIDQDIYNDSKVRKDSHKPKEVIEKVRQNCISGIQQINLSQSETKVYLISNFHPDEHNFPQLKKDIAAEFPTFNQEKLKMKTKGLIEMKKKSLEKRINDIANLSALDSRFSVMRFYGKTNTERIQTEIELYKTQFGIDQRSLENLERRLGDEIIREMRETLSQIEHFKSKVGKLVEIYERNENRTSKVVLGLTGVGLPINLMKEYNEVQSILGYALKKTASTACKICLEIQKQRERGAPNVQSAQAAQ